MSFFHSLLCPLSSARHRGYSDLHPLGCLTFYPFNSLDVNCDVNVECRRRSQSPERKRESLIGAYHVGAYTWWLYSYSYSSTHVHPHFTLVLSIRFIRPANFNTFSFFFDLLIFLISFFFFFHQKYVFFFRYSF